MFSISWKPEKSEVGDCDCGLMYVRNAVDVFLFYARMYNWGEFLVSKNARIICEVGETNLGK